MWSKVSIDVHFQEQCLVFMTSSTSVPSLDSGEDSEETWFCLVFAPVHMPKAQRARNRVKCGCASRPANQHAA
jgi:hypothetical protein